MVNDELNYNVGDIILASGVFYDMIEHKECGNITCELHSSCNGRAVFRSRRSKVRSILCPVSGLYSESKLCLSFAKKTMTNVRW